MIYTIAVVLLVLWLLGMVTAFTAGGLLHVLLVLAVVAVLYQLITGRSVGCRGGHQPPATSSGLGWPISPRWPRWPNKQACTCAASCSKRTAS